MLELTAIFLSALVAPFFGEAHPFVFNFGDAASGGGSEALAGLLLQVAAELLVDGVALWVEAGHGLPVTEHFNQLRQPIMLVQMLLAIVFGVLWTIYRCQPRNRLTC